MTYTIETVYVGYDQHLLRYSVRDTTGKLVGPLFRSIAQAEAFISTRSEEEK